MNEKVNVTASVFKLMRSMRRRPPRPAGDFPPSVGHMLEELYQSSGVSSRELCELLDIRPSSMSEQLARMEQHGLVIRTADENDKRVMRISLTESGKAAAEQIIAAKEQENAKFSACFTDDEAAQFCALCDKLSAHLETASDDDRPFCGCEHGPDRFPHHHGCHHHGGHHPHFRDE